MLLHRRPPPRRAASHLRRPRSARRGGRGGGGAGSSSDPRISASGGGAARRAGRAGPQSRRAPRAPAAPRSAIARIPLPIKHCLSTPSDQIWENTRTHEMRVLFLLLLGILVVTQTADASIQNANNIRNNKRLAKECEESYNAWASVTTCSVLVQPPVNNATNAAAPASALVCPATCRK
jgi:hypothetical protein